MTPYDPAAIPARTSESPTHPDAPRAETISPQARWKCACPSWTTARECFHLRYAPGDSEPYEECECACHEREDLNDYDV